MKIYYGTKITIEYDCAVSLGVFDGVHIGHQKVISKCCEYAKRNDLKSLVWTFSSPVRSIPLCTLEKKIELIEKLGADIVVVNEFTPELASISKEDFLKDIIFSNCKAKAIFCGFNYSFGKGADGNVNYLLEKCSENGIFLHVEEPVKLPNGIVVSSSLIRSYIETGKIKEANSALGYDLFT